MPFQCFTATKARKPRTSAFVVNDEGAQRETNAEEREAILGFPRGYTQLAAGLPEGVRLRLLGNTFSVPVVARYEGIHF